MPPILWRLNTALNYSLTSIFALSSLLLIKLCMELSTCFYFSTFPQLELLQKRSLKAPPKLNWLAFWNSLLFALRAQHYCRLLIHLCCPWLCLCFKKIRQTRTAMPTKITTTTAAATTAAVQHSLEKLCLQLSKPSDPVSQTASHWQHGGLQNNSYLIGQEEVQGNADNWCSK